MSKRVVVLGLVLLAAAAPLVVAGCGKPRKKQVGPLKEWIVGDWARQDDPNFWNFDGSGNMNTSGRAPIGGSYEVVDPDRIKVTISGANATSASMMLGVPKHENGNLYLEFVVKDDEMRPAGIKSETVFIKQ